MHKALLALVILAATLAGCGAASDEDQLVDTHWRLAAFTEVTPAFQGVVPAEEQANYTIDFLANDAFAAKADCNLVAGAYTARRSNLTITPGPTTMAFCGEESYGELYVHMLSRAATYEIRREQLTITLSGGAQPDLHRPAGPSASASARGRGERRGDPGCDREGDREADREADGQADREAHRQADGRADREADGQRRRLRRRRSPPPSRPRGASAGPGRTPPPASQGLLGYSWQLASISEKNPAFQGEIPADQRSEVHARVRAGRHVQRPRGLQHGHRDVHDGRRRRGVGQPDDHARRGQRQGLPGRLVR